MILVILTALTAVCGASKLEGGYLPPASARTAGGNPGDLQAPFEGTNQGSGLPSGGYTNDAQGVVVDAVNPGTRTSGSEPTGLGGPRASYGSINSKVGDAAFSGSGISNPGGVSTRIAPGFDAFVGSEDSDAAKTRGSSLKFTTDVGLNKYSYGFDTDNGISVGENGVAENGVQAQGGYSYKGDDGETYKVTYTADEGGYKPQGPHLPTPPPIPDEILISLEKNAKDEAAGLVDDGSYDAQKYNDGGDYSTKGGANNNARPTIGGGDATASGSFVNQGSQAYRPSSGVLIGSYKPGFSGSQSSQIQSDQGFGQISGSKPTGFSLNKDQSGSQAFGVSGDRGALGGQFGQASSTATPSTNNLGTQGQFGTNSQFSSQSTFNSQSTGNRFGVQASKPEGSKFVSPGRTPSFNTLPGSSNENSAFSSAVASGFGSATAFASTSSSGYGLKNENIPSFGQYSEGLKTGSDSSAGASFPTPSTAVASASVSGTPTLGQQYTKFGSLPHSQELQQNGVGFNNAFGSTEKTSYTSNVQGVNSNNQSPNLPSSASASASVIGSQPNIYESNQYYSGFKSESNQNNYPSRFGANQQSGNLATISEYLPPVKTQGFESSSTGTASQPSGSKLPTFGVSSQESSFQAQSLNSQVGQYSPVNNVIAPSAGLPQFGNTNTKFSSVQPTKPTLGFGTISNQGPTKVPDTELSTPFESSVFNYQTSNQASNSFTSGNIPVPSPTPASSFLSTQQNSQSSSVFESQSKLPSQGASGQNKPTLSQSFFPQSGPTDATFASSTQQPALNQQTGSDNSYYYKQPSKPFVTPPLSFNNRQPNVPVSTLSQQGSKYPSVPTPSTSGQFQSLGSASYNNGITQAAISPFPSNSPSSSKPTPSTQFGQSSVSQNSDSSHSPTQQYQGTIYQYEKPAESLPVPANTDSQAKPSQILTDSSFASQFNSQSVGSTPTSTFQQTQSAQGSAFGLQSNNRFGQKPNSQGQFPQGFQSTQKPTTSTFQQTQPAQGSTFGTQSNNQLGQKPNSQGQVGQGFQFGQKPLANSQATTSTFQQTQTTQGSAFGSQSNSLYGQKPNSQGQFPQEFQSTQKPTASTFQQTQSAQGSAFGLQTNNRFGQKPNSQGQFPQGFQSTQKPTTSTFQQTQTAQGSTFGTQSNNQFGQKPNSQGQVGQGFQFGQKPLANSQATTSTFQQTQTAQGSAFGPQSNNQFGQKPNSQGQFSQGFQSTQKPTTFTFQQTQTAQGSAFGSQSNSLFGQKPNSQGQNGQGFQFGQKPLASSQATTSTFQQTQTAQSSTFGAQSNKQFGQKPNSQGQIGQGYQFGQKPLANSQATISAFQQTQTAQGSAFGPQSNNRFGQKPNSQGQFPQGFQSTQKPTTSTFQETQTTQSSAFGSQSNSLFGQKPNSQGQNGQGFQFGQKPLISSQGTASTFEQTQTAQGSAFGPQSNNRFGQKPNSQGQFLQGFQSTQKPTTSTFQQTQTAQSAAFGSQSNSLFGQKPNSQGQFAQGLSGSGTSFNLKPQKPLVSTFSSNTQGQQSKFDQKPTPSTPSVSYYQQTTPSTGLSSSFVTQKPSYFSQKPFGNSQTTGSFSSQTEQSSSLTANSQGQTQFGQKPVDSAFQKPQFGSTGSQSGQGSASTTGQLLSGVKPQSTQGSYFAANTGSRGQSGQTSQFGLSGSTQNTGSGSSVGSGSSYQQSQFSSFSGSKFGQKPQTSGTVSQPFAQFGVKPFGSSQSTQGFQQTQFGSSAPQLGQTSQTLSTLNTISQTTQPEQKPSGIPQASGIDSHKNQFGSSGSIFGQKPLTTQTAQKPGSSFGSYSPSSQFGSQTKKPFGSTQTPFQSQYGLVSQFGQQPHAQANAFASSGLDAAKLGSTQSSQVSKYQQTSNFGIQGQKPVQSTLSQSNYQQSQYTQTSGSQTNGGTGQFGGQSAFGVQTQKPIGSQYNTFQSQFNQGKKPLDSNQGSSFQIGQSNFDKKIQPTQSSLTTTNVASQSSQNSFGSAQSANGYNYKKPESAFNVASQFGGQTNGLQNQKVQSTFQTQSGVESVKPFGSSSVQGSFQNAQSSVGSTQLGLQPNKETDSSNSPSQPSASYFSGKPFQPANAVSSQSSSFQTETSSTANSQFELQPTKPSVITQFSGQPFKPASFGLQSSQGVAASTQKPSQSQSSIEPFKTEFSSTSAPSFPTKFGSNLSSKPEGQVVYTPQTTIIPVPGYEIKPEFQGSIGEEFGGPRNPPRFDEKTGYHY